LYLLADGKREQCSAIYQEEKEEQKQDEKKKKKKKKKKEGQISRGLNLVSGAGVIAIYPDLQI
jgi:type III secretory pathway component EscU